jgi:hypothetical protein
MGYEEFAAALDRDEPGPDWDTLLKALWLDKKGDWDGAHSLAQAIPSALGSAVHAYLHREEGVLWNADYWYSRAGRSRPSASLETEWKDLVEECLSLESPAVKQ